MSTDTRDEMVLSYVRVRQALGYLGVGFPILLVIGGLLAEHAVAPSVSDYYHTTMRDLFVGSLFAIGVFLISYKGHPLKNGERLSDDLVATIAGIAAFGVAVFPNETVIPEHAATLSQAIIGYKAAAIGHYVSAMIFLGSLAYFCLVKFAKTAKPARRRIYLACGWYIVLAGVAATVASYFKVAGNPDWRALVIDWRVVFWLEASGIWAFGLSWLTKGRAEYGLVQGLLKRRS
ncbi:DUF998 domain-containing protein [Thalassobius vesicularis]|uniref:DUF998 domain-containing protein n=1 Tax=Thalassobius vesicularis TaxID=1294297 RepID=A0A4S3MDC5_9RHOB|nr:DUF998 domain-containing protein [Thalassobius vesicularis]THD76889.1 DUF998 domain-containing protein [Thalassobius vesicularis]